METLKPKISIVGCGNVGMRYAFALIIKGLARHLVLVDNDIKKAEGEAMDLSHGAPYISPVEITAGNYSDTKDSDIVVITAGKKQGPGQTRLDLVKDNVEIFKKIVPEIVKNAPDAILLIASNPVDILSYAAYKISNKPSKEVIGSGTVLDSARLRNELAKHCHIDPHNIHAYILGEHGDSEFALWSKAMIGGTVFKDYCLICENNNKCDHGKVLDNIFQEVKNSAYKIIEKKGETSAGIGLALARITRAILNNENSILPVSSLLTDYLGISDVYLSVPAVVNREGAYRIMPPSMDKAETQSLKKSAETLKNIIKQVGF